MTHLLWNRFLLLLLVLSLGPVTGCGNGPEAEAPGPDAPGLVDPLEGLQLTAGIDQASYGPGAPMRVAIQVTNWLEEERVLNFPTSQRYEILIVDSDGSEVHRWSRDRAFLQALGSERLVPGTQGVAWQEELPTPGAPGAYELVVMVPATEGELRAALPFEVSGGSGAL